MRAILLFKPVTKEFIHLVEKPEPKPTAVAKIQAQAEINPLIVVFASCIIAFHLAAAMIGSVAAWVYYGR